MENNSEILEQQIPELKEEKPKRQTNAEKLENVNEEIKVTKRRIKELKANKFKTDDENELMEKLEEVLSELLISQAKLEKKEFNAKRNAKVKAEKEKQAKRKQEAINRVLEEEGIKTENQVKGLIALRRISHKYGISTSKELDRCLDFVKQNAPHLFNNIQ